jgi:hypothetical protein
MFRLYFCRLLAREGINAEVLARDLKSFELKVTDERAITPGLGLASLLDSTFM